MSDASQLIAQQIAAAGITLGELTPVGNASKVYVDQQDAALQTNINSVAGVAASAQQTATGAQTTAGQAVVTANAAKGTADGAASAASTAQSAAAVAKQSADTAQDAADAAQERADAAYTLAEQGGGSSGPGFGSINGVQAAVPNDSITFAAGTGMAVSTDPETKTVTYTAQGTSAPGAHAETHITGGSDPIPNAVAGGNSGLMSGTDKSKLNGIASGANNYTHPATHPPSIIEQDSTNRFVTDAEKTTWNAKVSQTELTTHTNDTVIHVTQADKDKWNTGTGGGGGGTTASAIYYVDPAGSDTNDGLSTTTPFKTVAKALSVIPKMINFGHKMEIYTKSGSTFAEAVTVAGFYGAGSLLIRGSYTTSGSATISSLLITGCFCTVTVSNFSATSLFPGRNYVCYLEVSASIFIEKLTLISSVSNQFIAAYCNFAQIFDCTISNSTQTAISSVGSRLLSISNAGSSNGFGIRASSGGVIAKSGTQPAGTTAEIQSQGGVIRA